MDLMATISKWRNSIAIDFEELPADDPIKHALSVQGEDITKCSIDELGQHISVLANYYMFLSSEFGRVGSRVTYFGDEVERVKLNQLRPWRDSVKVKIDFLKKVYDRKLKQENWNMHRRDNA